jgi:hypothetical protein
MSGYICHSNSHTCSTCTFTTYSILCKCKTRSLYLNSFSQNWIRSPKTITNNRIRASRRYCILFIRSWLKPAAGKLCFKCWMYRGCIIINKPYVKSLFRNNNIVNSLTRIWHYRGHWHKTLWPTCPDISVIQTHIHVLVLHLCSSIVVNTVIVTAGNFEPYWKGEVWRFKIWFNKGNNKITELRTILQRESPNS